MNAAVQPQWLLIPYTTMGESPLSISRRPAKNTRN